MLLIYYNPQKNSFYLKYVNSAIFNKKVGDVNQFNHILIQALFIENDRFLSAEDFWDYYEKTKDKTENKKNKLIDKVICLLNKFKD